jgi:hypothetical protein
MDSSLVFLNTPYIVGKVLKSTKKRDNFQALEFKRLLKFLPKIFVPRVCQKKEILDAKKMREPIFTTVLKKDNHHPRAKLTKSTRWTFLLVDVSRFLLGQSFAMKKIKAPNFLGALTAEEGGEILLSAHSCTSLNN